MKNLTIIFIFISLYSFSQDIYLKEQHKCGIETGEEKELLDILGDHWGYSYDSLLTDIGYWQTSPYVEMSVIGQSVQSRDIYELTITDPTVTKTTKKRIYIHARTHPNEIQCFWVTDEIINYLIEDTEIGEYMRERCIFHIIPMYNPDGVELEYNRYNANGIDIESNWDEATLEIEVVHLRDRFITLMMEPNAIEIALNMHSAYACKRYFVYHHENNTSAAFAEAEEFYIESVRSHFIEGIEPYNYYVSWASGFPTQYPESWWWTNHQEQVMALTYEDMNCAEAGLYDKTAHAILHGISDFLDLGYAGVEDLNNKPLNAVAYPNPFLEQITIEWNNFENAEFISISDIYGRTIRSFDRDEVNSGKLIWDGMNDQGSEAEEGLYFIQILVNGHVKTIKVIKQ